MSKRPDLFDLLPDVDAPHPIWTWIEEDIPTNLRAVKLDVIKLLRKKTRNVSQILLTGEIPPEDVVDDVKELVDDFILQKSKGLKIVRDQIILLGRVIERGNITGLWKLSLPPVPVHIERERNPFTPIRFSSLESARVWGNLVTDSISKEVALSEKARVGRILLCALSRGGLLQINALEELLWSLSEPIYVLNGRSYIELSLKWRGNEDMETRRWFPDPLTEALILKEDVKSGEVSEAKVWPFIRSFFIECGGKPAERPKNMTALIDAIALELQLKAPPFIVNYAMRKFVSHSLKRDAWLRMNGVISRDLSSSEDEVETSDVQIEEFSALEDYGDAVWSRRINDALNKPDKQSALISLGELKEALTPASTPPLAEHIVKWAAELLKNGSKKEKGSALATVRKYVVTVTPRLYGLVGEEDIVTLNAEAFEEIYSQILEDASSNGMRRQLARMLRAFHQYLSDKCTVPKLDHSVLGFAYSLTPVDANIISIEEYERTLEILDASDLILNHPDLTEIAKLITIIGFRCGLRRSEVLKLRLVDVQGKVAPEILVRPHATRRLKTKNSTRRILLDSLLEKEELTQLLAWVDKRLKQEGEKPYSPYLFSIPDKQYAFVYGDLIFPAIHQALRKATGDHFIRFHHLRHSCASWNILRLMIADHGRPERFLEHLPKTHEWLCRAEEFRNNLYRHKNPTRKHLFAITSILGHSSPDMTLEHYIHWCDLLGSHLFSLAVKPLGKSLWVKLTGISQASVYRKLSQGGEHELLRTLRKRSSGKVEVIKRTNCRQSEIGESDAHDDEFEYSQIQELWKLLYLHENSGMKIEDLAERYAFTVEEVKAMVSKARQISRMKSRDRHQSHRHRMMEGTNGVRLSCPSRPRDHASLRLAEKFAEKLTVLMDEKPGEYRWLMNYYLNHAWHNSNDLLFRSPITANRFLRLVRDMGVPEKAIRLTWYHGQKLSSVPDSQRRQYWREKLALPLNYHFETKKKNDTRPLGRYGWMGIRLLENENSEQSSFGYRFATVMHEILTARNIVKERQLALVI